MKSDRRITKASSRAARMLVVAATRLASCRLARSGEVREDQRHSRRLVRFRHHARLHAGRSAASSSERMATAADRHYLEGSDQHRGWFQSSLLESCATRGRAPYDIVDPRLRAGRGGREDVEVARQRRLAAGSLQKFGADILRIWVASSDYADDPSFGWKPQDVRRNLPQAAQHDALHARRAGDVQRRRARRMPTCRGWSAGCCTGWPNSTEVRDAYATYDYRKAVIALLYAVLTSDLSAFYFDIRKDALYCEPGRSRSAQARADGDRRASSGARRVARADPGVHGRGGVAVALPADDEDRVHLATVPRRSPKEWRRRRARRASGIACGSAPRRDGSARNRAR